jgi:hypothetical protein
MSLEKKNVFQDGHLVVVVGNAVEVTLAAHLAILNVIEPT